MSIVAQPMGHITALQYREAPIYMEGGGAPAKKINVVRVHFRTPDGNMDHHDLTNMGWTIQNPVLQFMALHGYRPTSRDGTFMDIEDGDCYVPIVSKTPEREDWFLAEAALAGGEAALEDAEWFGTDSDEDGGSGPSDGPGGGGSPDPGTGNRGGVEMREADEDSSAGIEVVVE